MELVARLRPLLWLSAMAYLASRASSQAITPSNQTSDLYPSATSPRFLLNGSTEFPFLSPIHLAPLGPFAQGLSKDSFLHIDVEGHLVNVDASSATNLRSTDFGYLSCDPSDYKGELGPSDVFEIALSNPGTQYLILYSTKANHCNCSSYDYAQGLSGLLTTVDPTNAAILANLGLNSNSEGSAHLLPDPNSMTNVTGGGGWGSGGILGPSPTTAVAMIILYSITGIITALFIIIIVTGALRAHRHPERYGPRRMAGRARQSRAKGIARAMLETLPIVKFGDHEDLPSSKKPGAGSDDVELNQRTTANRSAAVTGPDPSTPNDSTIPSSTTARADGSNEDGTLGCSICTEDFSKGEEVRVLPCNHKFHPECVDPWLLNVSGTCPLCRIDLRPADESSEEPNARTGGALPPPLLTQAGALGAGSAITSLSRFAQGTREERIAALRRLRDERRQRGSVQHTPGNSDTDRRRVRDRLRERFRVRTTTSGDRERRGTVEDNVPANGPSFTEDALSIWRAPGRPSRAHRGPNRNALNTVA